MFPVPLCDTAPGGQSSPAGVSQGSTAEHHHPTPHLQILSPHPAPQFLCNCSSSAQKWSEMTREGELQQRGLGQWKSKTGPAALPCAGHGHPGHCGPTGTGPAAPARQPQEKHPYCRSQHAAQQGLLEGFAQITSSLRKRSDPLLEKVQTSQLSSAANAISLTTPRLKASLRTHMQAQGLKHGQLSVIFFFPSHISVCKTRLLWK